MENKIFENWKRYLKEHSCYDADHSSGWITDDLEYINILDGSKYGHDGYVLFKILYKNQDMLDDYNDKKTEWGKSNKGFLSPADYMVISHNWIRVANAFVYEGKDPKSYNNTFWRGFIKIAKRMMERCEDSMYIGKEPPRCLYEWKAGFNRYEKIQENGVKAFISTLANRGEVQEPIMRSRLAQFREE